MAVLDLATYKPVPATLGDANQIANGFQAIQNVVNALDQNNFAAGKILDPVKLMQNAAIRGDAMIWDGTNWAPAAGGWTALPALTYGTTDGPTFTATYAGDLTPSVPVGSRIKVTHAAATKYFIVTAHVAGTLTLYGGTTYTLAATAITNPFFSREKAPVGFPLNPASWTETLSDTSDRSQASPVAGTYYNVGSLHLDVPIGAWRLSYKAGLQIAANTSTLPDIQATLSSVNNALSDGDYFSLWSANYTVAGSYVNSYTATSDGGGKTYIFAAKTPMYLLIRTGAAATSISFLGSSAASTVVRAVCAYL